MKIKDLVDVSVDNACTYFPLDSERYELGIALDTVCSRIHESAFVERLLQVGDARIQRFIRDTHWSFVEAWMAWIDMDKSPSVDNRVVLEIVRLTACFSERELRMFEKMDPHVRASYVCLGFWQKFSLALLERSCATSISPQKDGGYPL